MKKQNQKGALLVEVIAVLGLVALITPILFAQIQRRNEEIVDAQIASEFRAVKDALSAYIQTNEDALAADCDLIDDSTGSYISNNETNNERRCTHVSDTVSDAANFFSGDTNILNEYSVVWYGRTVPSGTSDFRPIIYAIAYKNDPEPNLRRASKIAAMIGTEGGVFDGATAGTIQGMGGVWEKNIGDNTVETYTVAVTTSFDATTNSAILKDATFSNIQVPNSIQAGGTMVAKEMALSGILSVANDTNCIVDYMQDSVSVTTKETTAECAPVFEVNPETKEVKVAGVIRTGIPTGAATCSGKLNKDDCEKEQNCVWVPNDPSASNSDSDGECVGEFLLNPSGTSMVDDIKIKSLKGAKLSELLPTWILKNVSTVGARDGSGAAISGTRVQFTGTSECPSGYHPAVIVIPYRPTIINSTYTPPASGTHEHTHTIQQETITVTKSGNNIDVTITPIKIDDTHNHPLGKYYVYQYCVYNRTVNTNYIDDFNKEDIYRSN